MSGAAGTGSKIEVRDGRLLVPDRPLIPFIRGDGTGPDIWRAAQPVFDAAVKKAYRGERRVEWMEIFAGEAAFHKRGEWLPEQTISAIAEYHVAIKGPLTTPVGGGIRSLNVTLRQRLKLYACVRPVRWIPGVPSPVRAPQKVDMVIFRENMEDVYAGIEWKSGSKEASRVIEYLNQNLHADIPSDAGIGLKPISETNTKNLVRRAVRYALDHGRPSVTIVHKGNIMKFTEGAFRDWGYQLARKEFRDKIVTERESWIIGNKDHDPNLSIEANAAMIEPGLEMATDAFKQQIFKEVKDCLDAIYSTHGNGKWKKMILVNDRIADSIFQQILTRADEYQVLCTPNLNGDYLSDACAAQIGGLGLAPGANIGDGYGVFEATHGTAPKYADKDVINPAALIRSAVLMFEFIGWPEAGEMIERALAETIAQHRVTYDLERLMKMEGISGVTKLGTAAFADAIIENMAAVKAGAV
jgi:isocitrate dehydrogenase